jgi:hypothetical protein
VSEDAAVIELAAESALERMLDEILTFKMLQETAFSVMEEIQKAEYD